MKGRTRSNGVFFADQNEEEFCQESSRMEVVERSGSLRKLLAHNPVAANHWIDATAFYHEQERSNDDLRLKKLKFSISGDDFMIRERQPQAEAAQEAKTDDEAALAESSTGFANIGRVYRQRTAERTQTYWFTPPQQLAIKDREHMPLRVVRDDPPWTHRAKIEAGDLLKVANVWIHLLELCDRNSRTTAARASGERRIHVHEPEDLWTEESGEEPPMCYMCYDNSHTKENPIIAPCACKGSTKYCHAQCLTSWRAQNVERFSPLVVRMSYSCDSCRICGCKYNMPNTMSADGSILKLGTQEITAPYMVLQVLTENVDACREYVYYVSFASFSRDNYDSVTLGRCPLSNDLVLTDMAVSMSHLSFFYQKGVFSIEDEGSENGTYIAVQKPLQISASRPMTIAAGGLEVRMRHRVRVSHRIRQSLAALKRIKRSKGRIHVAAGNDKDLDMREPPVEERRSTESTFSMSDSWM